MGALIQQMEFCSEEVEAVIVQKFQNFMKKIRGIEKGFFFERLAGQETFGFMQRCEHCDSTEGVKEVTVVSEDNLPEGKLLCGSCALLERCRAYIRSRKLKIQDLEDEKRGAVQRN